MTDLAAGTFAAKFILYGNDVDAKQNSSERQTFIFDHVTSVEGAKSKTRPLAFQIVENSPALMLSGSSTEETDDWIKSLKELFWPKENVDEGNLESHLKLHRHVRCTYRFSALHSCLYTCTCVIFLSSPRLNFNACTVF